MKKVLFIIIIFSLLKCDISKPLKIDDNKVYSFQNPCGVIDFRASVLPSWVTLYQDFRNGEYRLNLDSIKIKFEPSGFIEIDTLEFYKEDELLSNLTQVVQSGDLIKTYVYLNVYNKSFEGTLLILPCSYIMCKDIPLINDTLRIQF